MDEIKNKTYSYERALYNIKDSKVTSCLFGESEIAESPLKECDNILVSDCDFNLRYPLWHVTNSKIENCRFAETSRAALWYDKSIVIENCKLGGIKALRECENIKLISSSANSLEFGWRCNNFYLKDTSLTSEYPFFECKNLEIINLTMKGKYSFQYDENVKISDSNLDTKDAFWHCKNSVIENCTIKGEYIGWYSQNLTFKNCKISGTQPFCYCENLTLIDCELIDADLAFEYSSVQASLKGKVVSIKNPKEGKIELDEVGEIIKTDSKYPINCSIVCRK